MLVSTYLSSWGAGSIVKNIAKVLYRYGNINIVSYRKIYFKMPIPNSDRGCQIKGNGLRDFAKLLDICHLS